MAQLEVISPGAFGSVLVRLDEGERFVSESGAMVRTTDGVQIDVTTRSRTRGGVLGGLKRLLGGETFFLSTYTAPAGGGEVVIAPTLPGDVHVVQLDGSARWLCSGGSFLACGPEIDLDMRFQGIKGFFSGESLFFLEASGSGPLVVGAFGQIREIECDGSLIVDTGHLVAFEEGIDWELTKAGSSWLHSFLVGEGFVMRMRGRGRVLVQTHNPTEFGRSVGRLLPPRS